MAEEFRAPTAPEDLLDEDKAEGLKVLRELDVTGLGPEDISDLAEKVVYEVCDQDALCIVEQNIFDQVYGIIRAFNAVPVVPRKRLLDSLCSNLSVLTATITAMAASGDDDCDMASVHRSAFKAYVFFLHWAASLCEVEARAAPPAAASAAPGRRGAGRRKAGAETLAEWDWGTQRAKIARVLCGISEVNLVALFSPAPVEHSFLQLNIKFAQLLLDQEEGPAMKDKDVVEAVSRVLAAAALRYGQLEAVAHSLFDVLNKHEHSPPVIADIAEFASRRNRDNSLAVELLRQVAAVDPVDYAKQMDKTAASVRSVGTFISELADRLPRTVGAHVALLVPHLGCKAYPIRSGIVNAIGYLIERGFESTEEDGGNSQANNARLRSKQGLLDLLVQRARDQTSWTRSAVCRAWTSLAAHGKVPMGHWLTVTQLAIGRLEDKSANVRKAALQLLATLLLHNPFGPHLPSDKFTVTLDQHKARLQELVPDEGSAETDDELAAAAASSEPIEVKAEPMDDDAQSIGPAASAADGEGEAASKDLDGVQQAQHEGGQNVAAEEAPPAPSRQTASARDIEMVRGMVASLQCAVDFAKAVSGALPVLANMLASSTVSDVQEAIALIVICHKFQIDGAAMTARKMLPLIFARDQPVKDAVVDALDELFLQCESPQAAENLVGLAQGSNLGELSSLEDVVKCMMQKNLINSLTIKALWAICKSATTAPGLDAAEQEVQVARMRAAMALITMVGSERPATVQENLQTLLMVGFGAGAQDAMVTRHACVALQRLALLPNSRSEGELAPIMRVLTGVLVAPRVQPAGWYSAAEAAVAAMYALHPQPGTLCAAIVHHLAGPAIGAGAAQGEESPRRPSDLVSVVHLSRLFFVIGHVALQHLLHVENMAKAVRRKRVDAEKAAAEALAERMAAGEGPGDSQEDINKELGVGSVSADLELDSIKDAADAQIVEVRNALGRYVPLIAAFCRSSALMAAHADLRSSALLALTKLMAIEASFCDANLRLLYTLLQNRSVEPAVRSNLVIAIGDLAFRFPNVLEPWTANMYRPLSDPDNGVRKNALMVLTHLILNDMMKVKGHIAKMAVCLMDADPRIASLATLFFEELSHKVTKNTNPIYNLLPDILSSLSAEKDLPDEHFKAIMHMLLAYIKRDKHIDPLADKLALRLGAVAEEPAAARNISFCLGQLTLSDKALRKLADAWKHYHVALSDPMVLSYFQAILEKMDKKSEVKDVIEDFRAKLAAKAAEVEEAATVAAAKAAAQSQAEEADAAAGMEEEEAKKPAEGVANFVKSEPQGKGEAVVGPVDGDGGEAAEQSEGAPAGTVSGLATDMGRLDLQSGGDRAAAAAGHEARLAVKAEPADDAVVAGPVEEQPAAPRRRSSRSSAAHASATSVAPLMPVKAEPCEAEAAVGAVYARRASTRRSAAHHDAEDGFAGEADADTVQQTQPDNESAVEEGSARQAAPRRGSRKSKGRASEAKQVSEGEQSSGDENDDAANKPTRGGRKTRASQSGKRSTTAASSAARRSSLRSSNGMQDWSEDEL